MLLKSKILVIYTGGTIGMMMNKMFSVRLLFFFCHILLFYFFCEYIF
jgi:hypothetical protein